jgi:hypothetical protein
MLSYKSKMELGYFSLAQLHGTAYLVLGNFLAPRRIADIVFDASFVSDTCIFSPVVVLKIR